MTSQQQRDQNDKQYNDVPINDKLKDLGVTKFVRHDDLVQIVLNDDQVIYFNIHTKQLQQTMERFRESARNIIAGLSNDIIAKMERILVNPNNDYATNYLRLLDNGPKKEEQQKQEQQPRRNAAIIAIDLVMNHCQEFFLDSLGQPYAAVKIDKHLEVLPLKSSRFKNWLCKTYFDSSRFVVCSDSELEEEQGSGAEDRSENSGNDNNSGTILNTDNLTNILRILEAEATFGGNPPRDLQLRVAKYDNAIYYDLTNPEWQVVKITADQGWTIEYSPILFRRYSHQLTQVYPLRDYPSDIFEQFMQLTNVKDNEYNKLLFKCYVISLFYPGIQHAALMLYGEKATAKSTLQELIKMLVDPSYILTLAFSKSIEGMVQKLAHNYVCFFDNVSKISDELSDILCRAVTGSGFSKRELFTDDDDIIYSFKRCVGINGINLGATKPDLIDRGIVIEHKPIPREKKRLLKDILQKFYEIRPGLLGYIFDIVVKVLQYEKQNPEGLKLKEYPRLADFAEVCEIISRCMGNPPDQFIRAYFANIELQTREVIESDLVGKAIEIFINRYQKKNKASEWRGTISNLFEPLTELADNNLKINTKNGKLWPQAPNSLSRKINEIKANLREIGITVEKVSADNNSKQWIIKKNQNLKENENISTEPTDNQESERGSQSNNDDIVADIPSIQNPISSAESNQNPIQDNVQSYTVDSGDICNTSLKDGVVKKQIEVSKGQQECSKNPTLVTQTNDPSVAKHARVSQVLDNYVAFDFEWNADTPVMEAASFVDSLGNSKVYLRSDFSNSSEIELLERINAELLEYDWSIGWNSTSTPSSISHGNNTSKNKNLNEDNGLTENGFGLDESEDNYNNSSNSIISDLGILYERCNANGVDCLVSKHSKDRYELPGLNHIDLCAVYGKVMVQDTIYKKAYKTHKLDEVSKVLLGYGKYKGISGKDFLTLSRDEQRRYSLQDSKLVMELSKHNNFEVLDAMYAISEITGLEFERVCRTNLTTWWAILFDQMIGKEYGEYTKPSKKFAESRDLQKTKQKQEEYKGGLVLEPRKGLYHNIVVVDAASLYPSVAINYNLSFDTINCRCCNDNPNAKVTLDTEFLKDCKLIYADDIDNNTNNNYCWICQKINGVFPAKLKVFRQERLEQKRLGNEAKQLALKILINGGYGVFGNRYFDYYDPKVAELITAFGRYTLTKMQSIAKDIGFDIIYGDTDSLFLNNPPSAESLFQFQKLCKEQLDIDLEIKNTYSTLILSAGKKHYIGYENGRLDIVGMEGKKSDRPEFVHDVFRQILNKIVVEQTDPIPTLRKAMSDLESGNIINPDKLKIYKRLGENPEDYKSKTSQCAVIGKALGAKKGDLIGYFDADIKKTADSRSWSTNPADIDIAKYKMKLWNTVKEVLEIAGYDIESLAQEFSFVQFHARRKSSQKEKKVTAMHNLQVV